MLLSLAAAWAAPCPAGVGLPELDATLAQAETAFVDLDVELGLLLSARAVEELACLEDPLKPVVVARFYRVQGVRSVEEGQDGVAALHFASARALEPDAALFVRGAGLDRLYLEVDPQSSTTGEVAPPPVGALSLDGRPVRQRAEERWVIAQYVGADGEVAWTTWLSPGQPLPAFPAVQAAPTEIPPCRRAQRVGLRVGAAGGVALAMGLVFTLGTDSPSQAAYGATGFAAFATVGGLGTAGLAALACAVADPS